MPRAPVGVALPHVRSHVGWALLSLLVCWPTALIALIYAGQVQARMNVSDAVGARIASRRALFWIAAGPVVVAIFTIVFLGVRFGVDALPA